MNRRNTLAALAGASAFTHLSARSVARMGALAAGAALAPAYAQRGETDVPFVTTPDNVVVEMLKLAEVRASDFVLDLGSGDGRIVITAAKLFGARGLGVEIDPRLVEVSNRNAQLAGVSSQARFVEQDLFKTDLAQASVITMYLLPEVNLMLKPALRMLKPGTRIVSHDWDMGPDWLPEKTVVVPAPDKQIGLRREAKLMRWTV
jgi:SAM-dependent methyltransferase